MTQELRNQALATAGPRTSELLAFYLAFRASATPTRPSWSLPGMVCQGMYASA